MLPTMKSRATWRLPRKWDGALALADAVSWTGAYIAMAVMVGVAGIGLFKACEPGKSAWDDSQSSYKPILGAALLSVIGFILASFILQIAPSNMVLGIDGNEHEKHALRAGALVYISGAWVPVFIAALSLAISAAKNSIKTEIPILIECCKAGVFIVLLGCGLMLLVNGFRTYGAWPEVISAWQASGLLGQLGAMALIIVQFIVGMFQSFFSQFAQLFRWMTGGSAVTGALGFTLLASLPFLFASGLGVWLRNKPTVSELRSNVALGAFVDYAQKFGAGAGLLLLMIATYRMTDTTMGVMAKPFYIDHGFTKTQFGMVSGSLGPWILLLGAVFAGISIRLVGFFKSLIFGEVLMIFTNAAFAWLASQPEPVFWQLFVTVSADNIAAGFAGTVFIAYMSSLTTKGFSATQYALFTSFFALYGKLLASMSGVLADKVGWEMFFVITALVGVPALLILLLVKYFKADQISA